MDSGESGGGGCVVDEMGCVEWAEKLDGGCCLGIVGSEN